MDQNLTFFYRKKENCKIWANLCTHPWCSIFNHYNKYTRTTPPPPPHTHKHIQKSRINLQYYYQKQKFAISWLHNERIQFQQSSLWLDPKEFNTYGLMTLMIQNNIAVGIQFKGARQRFMFIIQHCFICCPSDSTVSEDAGIEPRTATTLALAVRLSHHSARTHPPS